MAIGEFELIKEYFVRAANAAGVDVGIGDDCALLSVPAGQQLAISMDTLVADVHFPADADPEQIAERALRVNLSDLAAMGAKPLWFTLGLTLPDANSEWLAKFSAGLFAAADEFGCTLVGGDTTRGPLSITIQVHGAVASDKAMLRSGAKIGDAVCVTGCLGDAAAALAIIQNRLQVDGDEHEYLLNRFYRPKPQLCEGQLLAGVASAALDISDGLVADLGHICEQSSVGAVIHIEKLPLSSAMRKYVEHHQAVQWALCGGDDYQLCFTVAAKNLPQLQHLIAEHELSVSIIGEIVEGSGVQCLYNGEAQAQLVSGYNHFSAHV